MHEKDPQRAELRTSTDDSLSPYDEELLAALDPASPDVIAHALEGMSPADRHAYAAHHRELTSRSGATLLAFAQRLGFTDDDTEKSRWRDHMTSTRDAGDRQIDSRWKFNGPLHRTFVDTERRGYFLMLLRRMIVGHMHPDAGAHAATEARDAHRNRIKALMERISLR